MDNRRYYLLTLLPPLPGLGEPLPVTLSEALGRLREQGGRDFVLLADALEAEARLREAREEWVLSAPGSRVAPAGLPAPLAALFDEERNAGLPEDAWVAATWEAWFDLLERAGHDIGSRLLPRWVAWERGLRNRLAPRRLRSGQTGGGREPAGEAEEGEDRLGLAAVLAAWSAARERGREGRALPAAMEAEELLERARLDFLEREDPRYSFSVDELVAYLLRLRLLERRQGRDPEKGRALLRKVAAL